MRALLLGISVIAAGWAQDSLELHNPPSFKKGQIAESTDAGMPASAATAAKARSVASAEAELRRAYTMPPKSFDAALALGQFLMESGRGPEAQPFLNEAQTLLPDLRNHAAPARCCTWRPDCWLRRASRDLRLSGFKRRPRRSLAKHICLTGGTTC